MIFLKEMINKTKLIQTEVNEILNENNIIKLDLSRNDFGPLDIKYLTDYNLRNLKILDLSSNSIQAQGTFYLSNGKFFNLESLKMKDYFIYQIVILLS